MLYGWPTKGVWPYFQPEPLPEILTIANLGHAASRLWICAEPEFKLSWMKLCSSYNHCTTAPLDVTTAPRRHMPHLTLDALLGLDTIIYSIPLFPFGVIGEHKFNGLIVTTWIDFSSGKSNIFLASYFCLSHRFRLLLQMPVVVSCLGLNLL